MIDHQRLTACLRDDVVCECDLYTIPRSLSEILFEVTFQAACV